MIIKPTCQKFNTDRVWICILILKSYCAYTKYIKGEKNMVSDALSRLPLKGNQEATQKSTNKK